MSAAPPVVAPRGPVTVGTWTRLAVVQPQHHEALYRLTVADPAAWRWRFRGEVPSPEGFLAALYHDVLCQHVVEARADAELLGHVAAYGASHRHGYAYLSISFRSDVVAAGWPLEGAALFVDNVFRLFDLRKLYLQTTDLVLGDIASLTGICAVEEARLVGHEFHDGARWDQVTLAIYREAWTGHDTVQAFLDGARRRPHPHPEEFR